MTKTLTHQSPTLTDLLTHLIRMPTISGDQPTNRAAQDWVAEQLAGLPLDIKPFVNKGFPSLIATTPRVRHKAPRLWLAGHLDVVPGLVSDFSPQLEDGRLIGRGAYDMKFAVAVFIRLLQELGPELEDYSLGLMLTSDGELGGADGVRWLLDEQGYRGGAVLLPDCGTSWTLETGSKGNTVWQLHSRGRTSHGSRPWSGANAIDQITQFMAALKTNVPAEPCGDEHHAHSTINLGQISGGSVANQVPDYAEALVDIRLMPGISLAQAQAWFDTAAVAVPGVQAELLIGSPAAQNLLGEPAAKFTLLCAEIAGQTLKPTLSHGSSDGRYFTEHGIPVISVPPTGGGQHSDHEWIELAGLNQYYEIVRRFAADWAGPGSSPRA